MQLTGVLFTVLVCSLSASSLHAGLVYSRPPSQESGVIVKGACAFNLSLDLNDSAPLFTVAGTLNWLLPNASGLVELKNGQHMDMHCTEKFVKPFANVTQVRAQCLQGQYFLVNGRIHALREFSCTNWSNYTALRTGRACNGGTDLLRAGFVLPNGFLHNMDICHDEDNEATRYVHHVLTPATAGYQHSVPRTRFIEGDFYAKKNVDMLYAKKSQNITFSAILGRDASSYFNDKLDLFLARGHMAAKADFIYGSAQRATFLFVNVAPQWQSFNGGNWERVESAVRKYVSKQNLTLDCYTGTWGVSTLPDVHGQPQELYLTFDENNNGLIPVPMLYFRVMIDRATRDGIVLVGVNNPYASLQEVLADYVICEDLSEGINWIDWDKHNLLQGYSYACSVPDFIQVVKDLPLADLDTNGLLGLDIEFPGIPEIPELPEHFEFP